MKMRVRTVGEKKIKDSILKLLNLKLLCRHPSGDVEKRSQTYTSGPREEVKG